MTRLRLLLHSVLYYWRTNLAVLLGVVAGTAVIGGALLVGDSVRGSLRQMTLDRLGGIDYALSSFRFFREDLADEIGGQTHFDEQYQRIAPAVAMQGALERTVGATSEETSGGSKNVLRAGQVNIYGVDERLWTMIEHGDVSPPESGGIVLNQRAADQLALAGEGRRTPLQAGDRVSVWIEIPASIPRDLLLGGDTENPQVATEIPLTVTAILADDLGAARLSLQPNQQLPLVAFVALDELQKNLGLDERTNRRTRSTTPARINTLFVQAKSESVARDMVQAEQGAATLTAALKVNLQLADLMLRLVPNESLNYVSLESEQQILPSTFSDAARRAAEKLHLQSSPVLVYLANEIRNADASAIVTGKDQQRGYSMYSIVAGLDFPQSPPFGPFPFDGDAPAFPLGSNDIILNEWLAEDVQVEVGDEVLMTWHVVGSHGELPEEERRFRVAGIARLDDTLAGDRGLVPTVEGITDVKSFSDWRKPFPMHTEFDPEHPDQHFVTQRDEDYWDEYRATPKSFLQLDAAQNSWRSRYGQLTSFRVASGNEQGSLDATTDAFRTELLRQIPAEEAALAFLPVKAAGLAAASGTTDFAGLFFAFSFFLILSAMILIGLLFRLGIERRAANVGLLSAVGLTPGQVQRQLIGEGLIVVIVGGLVGVAAAVGYASLMVYGLRTWWIGAIGTRFLEVYVQPLSLVYGFGISVFIAAIAVWWALRQFKKVSTRQLLAGNAQPSLSTAQMARRGRWARWLAIGSAAVAGVLIAAALAGLIPASEAFMGIGWQAVAFFIVGIALLTASLALLAAWLDSDKSAAVRGSGLVGTGRLGIRNAARNRTRSVLTAGLIASATFVIVAVAAGHRDPSVEEPRRDSGNGGFLLVAESSTPILADLNTSQGRDKLGFDMAGADTAERQSALLDGMQALPFRVKPGENASCLNLYQTQLPTILGATPAMIERGGFKFVGADRENPWTLLTDADEPVDGVPVYPVLGDMNSLMYSLHKKVGDTIGVPSDEYPDYKLRIAGMFDGSVFQGVLVMSEANFQRLYPEHVGYQYFLIQAPTNEETELSNLLETQLNDYGFDADPVARRLASFLAVQNTYLSTFQTLGGLGLLLGTLGLATVMLRNVLERRSELAVLRAVGFRNRRLAWLVLWENAFLLVWGLAAGTISALLAMLPHLRSSGADIPWSFGAITLAAVFVIGMTAALFAVAAAVRTPIVSTLRAQ